MIYIFNYIHIFFIISQGIFILINCSILLSLMNDNHHEDRKLFFYIMLEIFFYIIFVFLLLFLRLWIMNFTKPIFSRMDNPASHLSDQLFRHINYFYVYLLNLLIMICPIWLCFDWSMGCIPLIETITDFRFSLILTTVIFSILLMKRFIIYSETNVKKYKIIVILEFNLDFFI